MPIIVVGMYIMVLVLSIMVVIMVVVVSIMVMRVVMVMIVDIMIVCVAMVAIVIVVMSMLAVLMAQAEETIAVSVTTFSVLVPMGAATQAAPDEKNEPGEHEDHPYNMALLGIDLLLKLQTNQGNDPAQDQRGQHMSQRGHERDSTHTQQAPALRARDDRQGHPVIGQDRVKNGHHTSGANQ
jgi:hypothetical protein